MAKRIAGAGLDVYEQEPKVHPGLLALDNVVLAPHLSSAARATREQIVAVVVENIVAFLRGDRPPNLFNPPFCPNGTPLMPPHERGTRISSLTRVHLVCTM